jgi:hypothetical protein
MGRYRKWLAATGCLSTASHISSDDMLKEASGKRPGPAGIEERFWKID